MGLVKESSAGKRVSLPSQHASSIFIPNTGKTEIINIQGSGKLTNFLFLQQVVEGMRVGLEIIADGSVIFDTPNVQVNGAVQGFVDKNLITLHSTAGGAYFGPSNNIVPFTGGGHFGNFTIPYVAKMVGEPAVRMIFDGIEFKKSLLINMSLPGGGTAKGFSFNTSYELYL